VTVRIGTSGWQYKDWRPAFYPARLGQAQWLEYYAERFATVEVNNAFYRLPEAETFRQWHRRTPEDFVMAVKASRYLTHIRRLRQPRDPVKLLMQRARHLGTTLGPVLLQLPPTLRVDLAALEETLAAFPASTRVAVEPRHESWYHDDLAVVLAKHNAAYCMSDSPGSRAPRWRTADWGYLRLHEGRARPHPCYGRRALETWAERLAELFRSRHDVYVFFNNDHNACALRDAQRFAAAVRRAGLRPTRVPTAQDVRGCGNDGMAS